MATASLLGGGKRSPEERGGLTASATGSGTVTALQPWAIFSEGERGWVDWPEPAPRGSWIIAELCKWKIDCATV